MSDDAQRALDTLLFLGRVLPDLVRAIRMLLDGDPEARHVLEILEQESASAKAADRIRRGR
jgi:hypothetical protein